MKLSQFSRSLVIMIFLYGSFSLQAQSELSMGFLDSTFSLVTVGGVASSILQKDNIEVQFNNTLTSFWFRVFEFNDANFRRISNTRRISQFNQSVRLQYGFSHSGRWDLGLEAKYNWYRDDDWARSSPFRIFSQENQSTGMSYSGLSSLGVRLRVMPTADQPNWVVQGSYSFPIGNHESLKKRLLNADLNQVDIITTYYNAMNSSTYYFLQANATAQFSQARKNYIAGGSFYLVKSLWNQLVYIYPGLSYTFVSQDQKNGGAISYTHLVFAGLGGQYSFRQRFSVYAFWQVPLVIDNGSRYSEIVRPSYTNVSLGLRFTVGR